MNEEREFICPSGHTVKAHDIHSTVKLDNAVALDDAIVFECPGGKRGHSFTLRKAVKAGTFTPDEAERIRTGGQKHREQYAKAGSK